MAFRRLRRKNLLFFVFFYKKLFFEGAILSYFWSFFELMHCRMAKKWSKTHENLFFPTLVISLGKNKFL